MFEKYNHILESTDPIKYTGTINRVQGLLVESIGPQVEIGELCQILTPKNEKALWAEVVGFDGKTVQLMPFDEMEGIEPGNLVIASGHRLQIPVSPKMLGRVLDGMGRPMDGKGALGAEEWIEINQNASNAMRRDRISQRIMTGIRALDFMTPVGKGQRMGIFSGSGVGKSTLIGMIARNTKADINVIALIGERGIEVPTFIEEDLGEEGLARSVLVVSTSDTPPLARLRGAYVATSIAEYFRDQGNDVMLLFDSVTRFARAQREIGLAMGEPPATRGYTPSVFERMPKLLERCGSTEKGTITGFYSILVEGDDMDEPVADNARGILDGHVVLNRRLADRYHYPAIDVLASISRHAVRITSRQEQRAAGRFKTLLAEYREAEDLINVGAYARGSNPLVDEAIDKRQEMNGFLQQAIDEKAELDETLREGLRISGVGE